LTVSPSTALRYQREDPDVRLMLQVRDGDAAAFDELMRRYQGRLITVLEHLVGQRGEAEDLAQEVFLRVYRARAKYVPGAKFATWLFTIANNVAANARRGRSRRPEVHVKASESGPFGTEGLGAIALAASGLMPTRQLDKAELQGMVQNALQRLNERQRMAVLLNKFEEMSYAEIGETMQLSPQAVKSLLCRARAELREALQPYLDRGAASSDHHPAT